MNRRQRRITLIMKIMRKKSKSQNLNSMPNFSFRAYADQTQALTRMRGMLEDEMTAKRAQKMKEI
jgi:hypothetical protein